MRMTCTMYIILFIRSLYFIHSDLYYDNMNGVLKKRNKSSTINENPGKPQAVPVTIARVFHLLFVLLVLFRIFRKYKSNKCNKKSLLQRTRKKERDNLLAHENIEFRSAWILFSLVRLSGTAFFPSRLSVFLIARKSRNRWHQTVRGPRVKSV